MEGQVYVCSWDRVGSRFRVWARSHPGLAAEGDSFKSADEELFGLISDATGDGENIHEYDPPSPDTIPPNSGVLFQLASVGGEGRATIANRDFASLFTNGLCELCSYPRGVRTEVPLTLAKIWAGFEGGAATGSTFFPNRRFFSERFLALLSAEERGRFEWRQVRRGPRAKKAFFEILSSRIQIPAVALREGRANLWECDECGWRNSPFYGGRDQLPAWLIERTSRGWQDLPNWYVNVSDLPDPVPSCFLVGSPSDSAQLCFTRERWHQIVGRPGTAGLASIDVGVVQSILVDQNPSRRAFTEVLKEWEMARTIDSMVLDRHDGRTWFKNLEKQATPAAIIAFLEETLVVAGSESVTEVTDLCAIAAAEVIAALAGHPWLGWASRPPARLPGPVRAWVARHPSDASTLRERAVHVTRRISRNSLIGSSWHEITRADWNRYLTDLVRRLTE